MVIEEHRNLLLLLGLLLNHHLHPSDVDGTFDNIFSLLRSDDKGLCLGLSRSFGPSQKLADVGPVLPFLSGDVVKHLLVRQFCLPFVLLLVLSHNLVKVKLRPLLLVTHAALSSLDSRFRSLSGGRFWGGLSCLNF